MFSSLQVIRQACFLRNMEVPVLTGFHTFEGKGNCTTQTSWLWGLPGWVSRGWGLGGGRRHTSVGGRGAQGPALLLLGLTLNGDSEACYLSVTCHPHGLGRERMPGENALKFGAWNLPLFSWPRWYSVVCWSWFVLLARANC